MRHQLFFVVKKVGLSGEVIDVDMREEIQKALNAALKIKPKVSVKDLPMVIKIFPASTEGPVHIKAMKAVFPDVKSLPLGGINQENLEDYLRAGAWTIGGTWICKRDLIEKEDFGEISERIKKALHLISMVG